MNSISGSGGKVFSLTQEGSKTKPRLEKRIICLKSLIFQLMYIKLIIIFG
jgi:hypothetical protein